MEPDLSGSLERKIDGAERFLNRVKHITEQEIYHAHCQQVKSGNPFADIFLLEIDGIVTALRLGIAEMEKLR